MKRCFKCGETKPLKDFYKHPQMGDGYLGKCKECAKRDVRGNRAVRIDYYRVYDRLRYDNDPERKEHCRSCPKKYGKKSDTRFQHYKEKFPDRYRANCAANNAIRDRRLEKEDRCEKCGATEVALHKHHEDYSKPLEVEWLCLSCHGETRKKPRVLA